LSRNDDEDDNCQCDRLIFSTQNPLAREKHENSYGEYFLFDHFEDAPVFQHFAGIEYLYRRDGHWLISDKIGLHEAGMQNQVMADDLFYFGIILLFYK
jgi:hypothetical protein